MSMGKMPMPRNRLRLVLESTGEDACGYDIACKQAPTAIRMGLHFR
jgi:hypothetical protein